MIAALLFGLAAAVGSGLRMTVNAVGVRWAHRPLPVATLAVNLSGSFALGLVAGWDAPGSTIMGVAGLGALTTFSTFSAEVVELFERNRSAATAYVMVSVLAGATLAWIGMQIA